LLGPHSVIVVTWLRMGGRWAWAFRGDIRRQWVIRRGDLLAPVRVHSVRAKVCLPVTVRAPRRCALLLAPWLVRAGLLSV
jgi:hypothetical protein